MFYMLRIEVDAHHNGGPPIKPWVARIGGPSARYGLDREFIRPMNDYRDAHVAWSGNVYGKVSTYPLRSGNLYEVAQAMGRSRGRRLVRRFFSVEGGKREQLTPLEALARVDGGGDATVYLVPEGEGVSVARVEGLGSTTPLGYVLVDDNRHYRLRPGVYDVHDGSEHRLVGVRDGKVTRLTQSEAWTWLSANDR